MPNLENEYQINKWHFDNIVQCFRDKRKKLSIALEKAFADGYDINYTQSGIQGLTALRKVINTIYCPNIEGVKLLIENGASVNIPDELGYIPLMEIANTWRNRQIALFHLIIKNTEDINVLSKSGRTAFSYFCKDLVAYGDNYVHKDGRAFALSLIKDFLDAGAAPYLDDSWLTYDGDMLFAESNSSKRKEEIVAYIENYMQQKQTSEANYEYEL